MSIHSDSQPASPRVFPSTRVGTSFTRDESDDHWMLGVLYPDGDIPSDPADWPDWPDADRWELGPEPTKGGTS
jgi:hypothetical protein